MTPWPSATTARTTDPRSPSARDRDRIVYSAAFRRLAGVTQVVGAGEGHVFHNRLTHTLEVAQLARRLAERFRDEYSDELAARGLTIDPEVAEAAALAHDLGHPPFGHVAEDELNNLVRDSGEDDGYEGNAQSFRIITRLAAHRPGREGLGLTRATLNATLKYPWLRGGNKKKRGKFGAYRSELEAFRFARAGAPHQNRPSLEARIMDHADNVAYSAHDVDDLYRAGLIPLELVHLSFEDDLERLKASTKDAAFRALIDAYRADLKRWVETRFPKERYLGDYTHRTAQRSRTDSFIDDFVTETKLSFEGDEVTLEVPDVRRVQMKFLQRLVWTHVIESPRLATQQHGQRHIVRTLFAIYKSALDAPEEAKKLLPGEFLQQLDALGAATGRRTKAAKSRCGRLAADIVSSFTDTQAVTVYRRLTGVATGSITDLLEG